MTHTHTCTRNISMHTYTCTYTHTRIDMASSCVQHISLEINCGFARCAILELTPKTNGRKQIDTQQQASKFMQLFSECTNYGIDKTYFNDDGKNGSLFNRDCTKTLQSFKKKSGTPRRLDAIMRKPFQLPTGKLYLWRNSSYTH